MSVSSAETIAVLAHHVCFVLKVSFEICRVLAVVGGPTERAGVHGFRSASHSQDRVMLLFLEPQFVGLSQLSQVDKRHVARISVPFELLRRPYGATL